MNRTDLPQLTLEERASLEKRLLAQARPARTAAVSRDDSLRPLTWIQESLWSFQQLLPESPVYNVPQAVRLRGSLDVGALQQAFGALLQRHEALRTRFCTVEGTPMQAPGEASFSLELVELSHLRPSEREQAMQSYLEEQARRPFNLGMDLPVRAGLICLSGREHVLAITLHHIVSDFASLALLHDELGVFYNAFRERESPRLPALPIQFPEWAARQRTLDDRALQDGRLAYWRERLSGVPSGLAFPTDRPRAARRQFRGASRRVHLSGTLTNALKRLASQEGVTLYMLLLAAWQTLLFRYSGQTDIVTGSPVGQRADPECERMIGCLVNTVPLRTDLSGNPSFRELLRPVREVTVGAFANQALPLEGLVATLQTPGTRQDGIGALCPVMFQYLPFASPVPTLEGVEAEWLEVHTGTAKFDLALTLLEGRKGLVGDLEFDTDLFDLETIDRLLSNFTVLLESIVANPETPIEIVPILSEAEREQVVRVWNRTATEYPREATVHRVFEAQAAANPDAVALACGGETLTYGALNQQANQLAWFLVSDGIVRGARAGVCLERSPRAIAALLAILKAGAAYVPLDAEYPPDRLEQMVRDAGISVVLTSSALAHSVPADTKRLLLDREEAAIAREPVVNLPNDGTAADLAYVMFTSGSTGPPKGVAIRHRGVVRLVKGVSYASFNPEEVFLQFAPLCFDASTFEIWGPLLNGARLAVFPPEFESLEQWVRVVEQEGVTTLWLTAGLFHELVEQHLDGLRGVRQLLAGGDVLSVRHVLKALQHLPGCQLINGYGPTENTTFTCCYSFPRDWPGASSAPIGRPIANTRVYILDRHLAPVPIGVTGELCIAGDGLAQGYVNSPELNEVRFVPDPFSYIPGSRLYKTGDQVRFLANGLIEFLGRTDDQVKINGFRIHLNEVERVLQQIQDVREVVVLAETGPSGAKQLLAWVVPGPDLSAAAIRESAAAKLPAFMVPAVFMLIEALPLTANGKIDRKMLPHPSRTVPRTSNVASEPANSVQERLLRIWRTVFERDSITLADNFFDLGGHSLLAARVISRINAAFGCSLSIAALFEAPTIPALEKVLARSRHAPAPSPIGRRARPASAC